ncbi:MAG: chorismate synthase [Lachnospiraceae bacterium]|nr:chorismate synthase [Lachnospiraceae bacterium]
MAGSTFGTLFRITTWGESHGPALGVVVDGCPAGIPLSEEDINVYMERRRPNGGNMSTARNEADRIEILSGVFEGRTTGTPISMMLRNTDQRSHDYSNIKDAYRPGHADFGYDSKYGMRDYRGGGRSSARETAARVAGGAVAMKLLSMLGISVTAELSAVGDISASEMEKCEDLVSSVRNEQDSIGSTVTCKVTGMPAGIGQPVFDKLDADLAKAIFSIGAVKGLDIGAGHSAAVMRGSENNDPFRVRDGKVVTTTNNAGGILGGLSNGSDIDLTVYFKPTPSIARPQQTVNKDHEEIDLEIRGRHDPVIGRRAAVVVECMTALVLVDALLINMSSRADKIVDFYSCL